MKFCLIVKQGRRKEGRRRVPIGQAINLHLRSYYLQKAEAEGGWRQKQRQKYKRGSQLASLAGPTYYETSGAVTRRILASISNSRLPIGHFLPARVIAFLSRSCQPAARSVSFLAKPTQLEGKKKKKKNFPSRVKIRRKQERIRRCYVILPRKLTDPDRFCPIKRLVSSRR